MEENRKFGVGYCDLKLHDSLITDMEVFPTYELAYKRYLELFFEDNKEFMIAPDNLWVIWLEQEKNGKWRAVQLDQLTENKKVRIIDVGDV